MNAGTSARHTEATRSVILEAAAELFLERGNHGFSVQEVADRAGLAHRTVYRYYATRRELLQATAQVLAPGFSEDPYTRVSTVEEWVAAVGPHLAMTEANFEIARKILSEVLCSDDLSMFAHGDVDRDAHPWEVFRRQFQHLPERDARRIFATLRHLLSSASYIFFRLRFGLTPADATEAIQAGALQIVELAANRDAANRRDSPNRPRRRT